MIKKSYILFLFGLLPFWCTAICSNSEIDFTALKKSIQEIDKAEAPGQFLITSADFEHFYQPADSRDNSLPPPLDDENSEEPEEKEEKNENNEDKDQVVYFTSQFLFKSQTDSKIAGLFSTHFTVLTIPYYILFHSWKSWLA